MRPIFPVLTLLAGCSPTLAGDWSGTFACTDSQGWIQAEATLELDEVAEDTFEGPFVTDGEMEMNGTAYTLAQAATLRLVRTAPSGSQDLEATWSDCEATIDGATQEEPCRPDEGWSWDGARGLTYTGTDDCEIVLER